MAPGALPRARKGQPGGISAWVGTSNNNPGAMGLKVPGAKRRGGAPTPPGASGGAAQRGGGSARGQERRYRGHHLVPEPSPPQGREGVTAVRTCLLREPLPPESRVRGAEPLQPPRPPPPEPTGTLASGGRANRPAQGRVPGQPFTPREEAALRTRRCKCLSTVPGSQCVPGTPSSLGPRCLCPRPAGTGCPGQIYGLGLAGPRGESAVAPPRGQNRTPFSSGETL